MSGGEENVLSAEQVEEMTADGSLGAEWIRLVPWSDSRTELARQLNRLAASHEVLRRRSRRGEENVLSAEEIPDEIAKIRAAFRYAEADHHRGCDTHIGKECDCYFKQQAEAEAALASLRRRSDETRAKLEAHREAELRLVGTLVGSHWRDGLDEPTAAALDEFFDAVIHGVAPYDPLSDPDVPESALLTDVDVKGDRMAEAEADR